jgi:uridylate kinase
MTTAKKPKYSRILLKLSGEALGGENGVGICSEAVRHMAGQIREVRELGVQVVVVVGGGNIFRGASGSEHGIERATGDYMGMLATIINALALQDALEKLGRAVHPPPRGAAPGKGPRGNLRRRNRQSVFFH